MGYVLVKPENSNIYFHMNTEIAGVIFIYTAAVLFALPLGKYIARVFGGQKTILDPVFNPWRILFPFQRYWRKQRDELERKPCRITYH